MSFKEEWERLAPLITTTGAGGLIIAVARLVIQSRYGSALVWVSSGIAAVLVAILVGLALHDSDLTPAQQAAVIGVCAFLADDILIGLGALARLFGADPIGTAKTVWNAIRGKEEK